MGKKKATKKKAAKKTAAKKTAKPRLAWMGLKPEELEKPGGVLLAWLVQAANERGMQMQEMAAELGVTYGYISQLRTGIRQTRHISDEFADNAARFLGVPRIAILMAAGRVRPDDFLTAQEDLETELDRAIQYIQKDPKWGPILPPSAIRAGEDMKLFIVFAYEEATGRQLLPGKADALKIAQSIKEVQEAVT